MFGAKTAGKIPSTSSAIPIRRPSTAATPKKMIETYQADRRMADMSRPTVGSI